MELDATGAAPGRGAYLHPDPGCLDLARRRRALERALRARVPEELWERAQGGQFRKAAERHNQ